MPGHLALIRGNESHIGDYNLIFFVLFFVVGIVVTVSVTRQSPIYIYIFFKDYLGPKDGQGCHYIMSKPTAVLCWQRCPFSAWKQPLVSIILRLLKDHKL